MNINFARNIIYARYSRQYISFHPGCPSVNCGASKFDCNVGMIGGAAILIRQVGTGSDDNKNEGILLQRLFKRQASVKNNENQGL